MNHQSSNTGAGRRQFLKTMGAGMMVPFMPGLARASAGGKQPNILLILADDLGYEMLGCYGGLGADTPVLDRLARRGTLFSRAYTSAVCTPSRMSLYTGTYAPRHQFTEVLPVHLGSHDSVDFKEWPTYAEQLREAGYATSVTGKWQLAAMEFHPDHCRQGGFDSWCVWQIWKDGEKTTRYWNPTLNRDGRILEEARDRFGPDVLTDYVIDQMRSAKDKGQPFCIHHNMMLPHIPIIQTPEDRKHGRDGSLREMVRYMDAQIGRLLEALDELQLTEDTLVIFAGDNGTESREPRMTTSGEVSGGKFRLNDAGTHVPLIVSWPGTVPAGRIALDLVDFADFYPTLCDLAGVSKPPKGPIDGLSFAPVITGKASGQRKWVTAAFHQDFFVFDGSWRLHHRGDRLVDCRNLPLEKEADMSQPEAIAARAQLMPILEQLRRLS